MNSWRTCCRCRRLAINIQSRHSRRIVPTNRSATAFAFDALTGVWSTRIPSALNTVSNALVNLPSLSGIRSSKGLSRLGSENTKFLACCAVQAPSGFSLMPARRTRRVEGSMKNSAYIRRRLIVSTVKKSHAITLCLAADELTPRHPTALASRSDPGSDQDVADTRRGDLDPETDQPPRDPPVSPPRVLASQPQDQLTNLTANPWPVRTASRIRPAARNDPPVPREQRFRGHKQHRPAV